MTIWLIVLKSLRQHALSTAVTALSIALAGGLLISVWVIKEQSYETFTGIDAGFDAVLGARSSKLQLVLNAIFHLEASPANISRADYEEIKGHPSVARAVPLAMGDNYRGYRIVGTVPEFFLTEYAPEKHYRMRSPGRVFDPRRKEAVVGSFAARKLNLRRGDFFHPYHGLIFDEGKQHAERYVVVGILEPSNTPADKVIWIPLEGVQKMEGHASQAATEISAVLVQLRSPIAGQMLDRLYNKQGNRLTFAWPIDRTIAELLNKIGWFERVLALVSYLVAFVAASSILASIYNSMNERRRQLAVLRALGARRATIFCTVVLEAACIAALGMLISFFIHGIVTGVVASVIRAQTGVVIEPWKWNTIMIWAPLGLIGLSALAGVVPAIKAYRTDVASNLVPTT